MNNIFKFATGELSQDAFICWFFNWFNEGDNGKLKQLVCDFCREKLEIPCISSVDIIRQYSKKVEIDNASVSVKIDVLVMLNNDIAVIIEDKTFTSEHSNQINRYKKGLEALKRQNNGKLEIEGKQYNNPEILCVYWKTGFFYDCDKSVVADKIIKSEDLIKLFQTYRNENELINMYVQKLLDDKEWYETHKEYWAVKADNNGRENLSAHQYTQYTLAKELFPEWKLENSLYYVEHGSSFGRPWTEICVYKNAPEITNEEQFCIFWRIDTDKDGCYISLRLYKYKKGKWDEKYDKFKERVENYLKEKWDDKWNPGKTDSYKEADIAHFSLNKTIWEEKGKNLQGIVKGLTDDILVYAREKHGENVYERNWAKGTK